MIRAGKENDAEGRRGRSECGGRSRRNIVGGTDVCVDVEDIHDETVGLRQDRGSRGKS